MRIAMFLTTTALIALGNEAVFSQEEQEATAIVMTADVQDSNGDPVISTNVMRMGGPEGIAIFESSAGGMTFTMNGGFAGGDSFQMLRSEDIQKEIELVAEQQEQLDKIRKEFAKRMKDQLGDISKGPPGEGFREAIAQIQKEQKEAIENILLPHQIDRLQQISLQSRMKNQGAAGVLADKMLAEALGISDEQKEVLKKRSAELATELQEKIEKLREETREKLLQELRPDQREKLKSMMGERFEGQASPRFDLSKPGRNSLMRSRNQ